MPRRKIISDAEVFAHVRRLLVADGDKAVAFGPVARATGLAAATLVQRYSTRDGMVRDAVADVWKQLDAALRAADAVTAPTPKGAQALLKAMASAVPEGTDPAILAITLRDPALRDHAMAWRAALETALAQRLGAGTAGREAAGILFAAWHGQRMWAAAGDKSFRTKDAIRRLT